MRQRHPTMSASVLQRADALAHAPQQQRFTHDLQRLRSSVGKVRHKAYGIPVVPQPEYRVPIRLPDLTLRADAEPRHGYLAMF
jgi:hypothetical protein